MEILLQAIDLGISDIGSIKEGEKVEDAELFGSAHFDIGWISQLPMGSRSSQASKVIFDPGVVSRVWFSKRLPTHNFCPLLLTQMRVWIWWKIMNVGMGERVLNVL